MRPCESQGGHVGFTRFQKRIVRVRLVRRLTFPDLIVQPQDRIALTGPNGGGKSTLVRHIVSGLALPTEQVLYVPQEISVEQASTLLENVKRLPSEHLGHVMQWVRRLGSEPTNPMDLPSIGCLESALHETECALLLVSHDPRFLEALTALEWQIAPSVEGGGGFQSSIHQRGGPIASSKASP